MDHDVCTYPRVVACTEAAPHRMPHAALTQQSARRWTVRLGACAVSFKSEARARATYAVVIQNLEEEGAMSKSKKTKRSPKKVRKPDPVVKVTPLHNIPLEEPKPKKETPLVESQPTKAPREDLMVFAFRLTREESALIHKAAGPGKASKFVRMLSVAAARGDMEAVREIVGAPQA